MKRQDIESNKDLQDSLAMLKMVAESSKSKLKGKGETIEKAFNDVRKQMKKRRFTAAHPAPDRLPAGHQTLP
jgi:hypothetical protein